MNKTKLIQLLKTFSLHEFLEFGKFVNSPIHNESQKMIILYDSLKWFYPDFNSDRFTKEGVFQKLYGNEKYDDKKFRDRFSDLLKLAEEYLALVEFKCDKVVLKRHTLNQFAKRSLKIHFDKVYREIKAELDKVEIKNNHYFYESYLLLKDKYIPFENEKPTIKYHQVYNHTGDEIDMFLYFFVSKMLKYYLAFYSMERHMTHKFEYKLYEPVMEFVRENDFEKYPSIKIFYLLLCLFKNMDDDKLFYELKDLFIAKANTLEARDKVLILTELFHISQSKLLSGKKEFETQRFELMDLSVKYDIYPELNGWMRSDAFINNIQISLAAGKSGWAKNFLKCNLVRVAPELREDVGSYSESCVHYYDKNYNEALKHILKVRIKNSDYQLYTLSRSLISRIYFELRDYENLFLVVDSFKHYLATAKLIPENDINRYLNYLNVLHKLALLSAGTDQDDFQIKKLQEKINKYKTESLISNGQWLLEKVSELK